MKKHVLVYRNGSSHVRTVPRQRRQGKRDVLAARAALPRRKPVPLPGAPASLPNPKTERTFRLAERKRAKTSGTPASIREALKKATTEMLVLFVLRQKKMYTYEMMQEISHMSDGKIAFNTLYQAIYRLQSFQYIKEDGKVVSDDNRIRIYFTITPSGEEYLDKLMEEYHSFTGAVDHVLSQTDVLRGK